MRWQVRASVALLVAFALVGAAVVARTDLLTGLVSGVVMLVAVAVFGWWSLRKGRHTPWSQAVGQVAPGHAVVLWKPGCPHCERLLRALRSDDRVTWVNVWQDAAAQHVCRSLNNGDEYTPTVLVGLEVLRNPAASEVRAALTA